MNERSIGIGCHERWRSWREKGGEIERMNEMSEINEEKMKLSKSGRFYFERYMGMIYEGIV
jgi:hypothetical protein